MSDGAFDVAYPSLIIWSFFELPVEINGSEGERGAEGRAIRGSWLGPSATVICGIGSVEWRFTCLSERLDPDPIPTSEDNMDGGPTTRS